MQYRKLGRTGVEVSALCLGCMNFGGRTDPDASAKVIARAIDAGINFLDTANVYSRGKSEQAVGAALAKNHDRDEVFLATKAHGRMKDGDHQPNRYGNSRRMIIEECHNSLRRLQTDYIDLYQIHRPQNAVPIDETLRALDDLVRQGKVRYLGSSTFAAWQVVESLWAAKELGLNRFICEQPPYNLLERRVERELVPMAQTFGLALIPWSPLAGGFLTGKYTQGKAPAEEHRLRPETNRGKEMLESDQAFGVVGALNAIAAKHGCTPSAAALAWCRDQPGVTSPIIGPRTIEQLEDNLTSDSVALDDDDRSALDAASPPGGSIVPYYQAEFGPHQHRAW